MGTLLLFLVGFGWAKPVSVDARYYENPKQDMVKVALAGPIMNFLVAFLAIFIRGLIFKSNIYNGVLLYIFTLLEYVVLINVGLGLFNLIPIPPLDGSKVLFAILPAKSYFSYMRYEQFGMIALLIFIYLGAFDGFLVTLRWGIISGMQEIASNLLGVA